MKMKFHLLIIIFILSCSLSLASKAKPYIYEIDTNPYGHPKLFSHPEFILMVSENSEFLGNTVLTPIKNEHNWNSPIVLLVFCSQTIFQMDGPMNFYFICESFNYPTLSIKAYYITVLVGGSPWYQMKETTVDSSLKGLQSAARRRYFTSNEDLYLYYEYDHPAEKSIKVFRVSQNISGVFINDATNSQYQTIYTDEDYCISTYTDENNKVMISSEYICTSLNEKVECTTIPLGCEDIQLTTENGLRFLISPPINNVVVYEGFTLEDTYYDSRILPVVGTNKVMIYRQIPDELIVEVLDESFDRDYKFNIDTPMKPFSFTANERKFSFIVDPFINQIRDLLQSLSQSKAQSQSSSYLNPSLIYSDGFDPAGNAFRYTDNGVSLISLTQSPVQAGAAYLYNKIPIQSLSSTSLFQFEFWYRIKQENRNDPGDCIAFVIHDQGKDIVGANGGQSGVPLGEAYGFKMCYYWTNFPNPDAYVTHMRLDGTVLESTKKHLIFDTNFKHVVVQHDIVTQLTTVNIANCGGDTTTVSFSLNGRIFPEFSESVYVAVTAGTGAWSLPFEVMNYAQVAFGEKIERGSITCYQSLTPSSTTTITSPAPTAMAVHSYNMDDLKKSSKVKIILIAVLVPAFVLIVAVVFILFMLKRKNIILFKSIEDEKDKLVNQSVNQDRV